MQKNFAGHSCPKNGENWSNDGRGKSWQAQHYDGAKAKQLQTKVRKKYGFRPNRVLQVTHTLKFAMCCFLKALKHICSLKLMLHGNLKLRRVYFKEQ